MKTNVYLLLLATLYAVLFSACQKETFEDTTIQGKVLTKGTEEAIRHPPVRVVIYEEKEVSTWGSSNTYSVVAETMSNEDGSFSLNHSLSDRKKYFVGVDESTVSARTYYWPEYPNLARHKIHGRGGTQKVNYYLVARGWVEFHFKSEHFQPGDIYGYNLGGGASRIYYSSVNDSTIWDFAGNVEHEIALNKFTNDQWTNWQEKFFVPAFDTISYQVTF